MFHTLCLTFVLLNLFTAIKRTDEIPDLIFDQRNNPLKNVLNGSFVANVFSAVIKWYKTTASVTEAMDRKAHGSSGGLKDEEKSYPKSEGTQQPLLLPSTGL